MEPISNSGNTGESKECDLYVTFELGATGEGNEGFAYPGLRCLPLRGQVSSWQTDHFDRDDGSRFFGIRITYMNRTTEGPGAATAPRDDTGSNVHRIFNQEIVELPEGATNIQLHIGKIPSLYDEAFNAAV